MASTGGHERIAAILAGETTLGLSPAELLDRFAASRDEAAFAALVAHHGPMVLATCRRLLGNRADADDAFQATFLVLARQAGAIQHSERLAPWLHSIARRVSVRARSNATRRRQVEGEGHDEGAVADPPDDAFELRAVLDEELARLPAKYRDPLVLCYLEGLTHDEAAGQLSWPVGTVRSRLAGGRDRLRARLTRRGFDPAVGALPPTLPLAVVSRSLQAATVRLVFAAASKTAVTSAAVVLAQGVLTSMFLTKIQAVAIIAATALTVAAVGVVTAQPQVGTETKPAANPPVAQLSTPTGDGAAPDLKLLDGLIQAVTEREAEILKNEQSALYLRLASARDRIDIDALKRKLGKGQGKIPDRAIVVPDLFEETFGGLLNPDARYAGDERYTRDLQKLREQVLAENKALKTRLAINQPESQPIPKPVVEDRKVATEVKAPENPQLKASNTPEPAPTVKTLKGSPTILMVTSGTRDRVTMIDPATQKRATLRLAQPAEMIVAHPNVSDLPRAGLANDMKVERLIDGLIELSINGPNTRQAAVFDRNAMLWFEHELPQPVSYMRSQANSFSTLITFDCLYLAPTDKLVVFDAKERTWPTLTLPEPVSGFIPSDVSIHNTVCYEAGRFICIYNQPAKKWSVLTLKASDPERRFNANLIRSVDQRFSQFNDGKLLVPEGDLIHIYDVETAEWTQINTNEDK